LNNLQPGVLDLMVRAHFDSLQLEAENRRRANHPAPPRRPRRDNRRSPLGALRVLRSLGSRNVPAPEC
jgi:hypothetical protein